MSNNELVVTVGTRRVMEYVVECLSRFNRGENSISLVATGQCISKAAEVAQILATHFHVEAVPKLICKLERNKVEYTTMKISLTYRGDTSEDRDFAKNDDVFFIEYPIYHLLLDTILSRVEKLSIGRTGADQSQLLEVSQMPSGTFRCKPLVDNLSEIDVGNIVEAFYRSGLLLSPKWEPIGKKLSEYDDVVLGVDTNILYNCVITHQVLDSIVYTSPANPLHTPNWILIVIPSAVMHEIEQAANVRDEKGLLNFEGRMGYRALQEILTIQHSKELMGVSLLIVGEANPAMDTRVELRGLRADFKETAEQKIDGLKTKLFHKTSAGDTIIRDQFKRFLSQLSFHKGSFFFTADKSNAALAQAEGLHSIYYQSPSPTIFSQKKEIEPPSLRFKPYKVFITVPLGKLIYELAVQFGNINIRWDNTSVRLHCDGRGDTLDHWVHRDLRIYKQDFDTLKFPYVQYGKFSLKSVRKVWKDMEKSLMGEV